MPGGAITTLMPAFAFRGCGARLRAIKHPIGVCAYPDFMDVTRRHFGALSLVLGVPVLGGACCTGALPTDKYARQVRSSAGIVVFAGPDNDRAGWIEAGPAYERFALQATAMGVRTAHLNQPMEMAALRPGFAGLLGIGVTHSDLVVRFGRGPQLPTSPRRPVQAMLA